MLRDRKIVGHGRSLHLVGLLLLTLVLTAVLAYQAADAARSHRAVAESTLRDYAAVAAWQYGQAVSKEVFSLIGQEVFHLEDLVIRRGGSALIKPAEHAELHHPDVDCACPSVDGIRYIFLFDPSGGDLAVAGNSPGPEVLAWLGDTIRAVADQEERDPRGVVTIVGEIFDEPRLVSFRLRRARDGSPARVVGYEAAPEVIVPRLAESFRANPLLPSGLTRGKANDSLVAIAVHDRDGGLLFRTSRDMEWEHFAEEVLGDDVGGLVVRAAVRPDAASLLLIGGLPRSRLPLLVGLMVLSAGLMVAAVVQIRREVELARLRADFVSGVSHELRTPLAQIRMFGETLLLGRVRSKEEGRRSARIIVQEAGRLTHLVDNVLHFARSGRHAIQIAAEPCRLDRLVREVVAGFAPLAASREVTIRIEAEEPATALADPHAVTQILLNLLDNAVKYGPMGQTITVEAVEAEDSAVLAVEDEGPGIPPEAREGIFEPFARLDQVANGAVGGSGIGLAVVRSIAELHGGRVRIEEGAGGGARFVVVLPAVGEDGESPGSGVGRSESARNTSRSERAEGEGAGRTSPDDVGAVA